jgi:hypothetical protein
LKYEAWVELIGLTRSGRSFPLYSKGIEKYRYEYAIFLLNKDIEMVSPASLSTL